MSDIKGLGVGLPLGFTGSSFLYSLLVDAVEKFPDDFSEISLPTQKEFKKIYDETLVHFEAARTSSINRTAIAQHIVNSMQNQLRFTGEGYSGSFMEYLKEKKAPGKIDVYKGSGGGYTPEVPFRGRTYKGKEIGILCEMLMDELKITKSASDALQWAANGESDGRIDLSGHRFVILGAGAEVAPTRLLLEAGATVLWIDIQSPDLSFMDPKTLKGELHVAQDANDILNKPREIRSAIEAFADGSPVHLGLFAYAPGASQEWRLATAMNGIVKSIDPTIVGSVAMLISPTSTAVIQPEDIEGSEKVGSNPPAWQAALKRMGQLRQEVGFKVGDGFPVARAIVPIQGVSYQAAQYVSKILAAEVFSSYGTNIDSGTAHPVTVSANVAGITKTKSLNHPVFQAAFLGAGSFGVEIFEVETTRALSGLLILHDLLNPKHRGVEPKALFSKQLHGGIYSRPYALNPMIRIATVMGLARKPKLLFQMF